MGVHPADHHSHEGRGLLRLLRLLRLRRLRRRGGAAESNLSASYQSYLGSDRGKSPAIDDASTSAAMSRLSQMPY